MDKAMVTSSFQALVGDKSKVVVVSFWPLIAALVVGEQRLHLDGQWFACSIAQSQLIAGANDTEMQSPLVVDSIAPQNQEHLVASTTEIGSQLIDSRTQLQEAFIALMSLYRKDLERKPFSPSELKATAAGAAGPINERLEQEGFDIRLQELPPNSVAIICILELLFKWQTKGSKVTISGPRRTEYAGVQIDDVTFYQASGHQGLIAEIPTVSGDQVFMTKVTHAPQSELELEAGAEWLLHSMRRTSPDATKGVQFPEVVLKHRHNLDWLLGMYSHDPLGQEVFVSQAVAETILTVDSEGMQFKQAAAVVLTTRGGGRRPSPMIIDEPFLLIVKRPGLDKPLIVAYLATESWKPMQVKSLEGAKHPQVGGPPEMPNFLR